MSIKFLKSDFDKVSYLANLLTARATGLSADTIEYNTLREELLNNQKLSTFLPDWIKLHPNLDSFWGFIKAKFTTYAERRTYISEQFTKTLDHLEAREAIKSSKPELTANCIPESVEIKQKTTRNKRKVFIVHGHDNETKLEISRFIEKLGIQTIILHEQASSGMTIIEKIEKYSNDADFALVLYTACDKGKGAHEPNDTQPKNRARQNVVFEHGYLMAKLGRENVCSLVKGDIETPNDITGVVYVKMDKYGAWKTDVEKELKACGYAIK
jgi:predicted nucleotide-binding protein